MQSHVMSVGVHNAMSKKKVKLFKEENKSIPISKEQKEKQLSELMKEFE